MAEITIADSEFEDTYIQSTDSASTAAKVNSTNLVIGAGFGIFYSILLQLELVKRPRFIPVVGDSSVFESESGYPKESRYKTRSAFTANSGLGFVNEIDPSIDTQDLAATNYVRITASPSVNWTTAGALDDIVPEPAVNWTFGQTSANQDFDLLIPGKFVRRAMFRKTTLIYHNNNADDIQTLFASQENSSNFDGIVLRGRYATRNRENPIRSRKFGVR